MSPGLVVPVAGKDVISRPAVLRAPVHRRKQEAMGGIGQEVTHSQDVAVGRRHFRGTPGSNAPPTGARPARSARRRVMRRWWSCYFPTVIARSCRLKPGLDDHHEVNEHEKNESHEREEVDGARRLVSAERESTGTGIRQ